MVTILENERELAVLRRKFLSRICGLKINNLTQSGMRLNLMNSCFTSMENHTYNKGSLSKNIKLAKPRIKV